MGGKRGRGEQARKSFTSSSNGANSSKSTKSNTITAMIAAIARLVTTATAVAIVIIIRDIVLDGNTSKQNLHDMCCGEGQGLGRGGWGEGSGDISSVHPAWNMKIYCESRLWGRSTRTPGPGGEPTNPTQKPPSDKMLNIFTSASFCQIFGRKFFASCGEGYSFGHPSISGPQQSVHLDSHHHHHHHPHHHHHHHQTADKGS